MILDSTACGAGVVGAAAMSVAEAAGRSASLAAVFIGTCC